MFRELGAECVGTFALVTGVCGAGLFSAPSAGLVAVAFAVGLSVMAMGFAVGPISGGHFNPGVTLGVVAGGGLDARKTPGYLLAPGVGGAGAGCGVFLMLVRAGGGG